MMTFLWVTIIILAVFCEAQTASLVSIWFMPAGLVALILSMCQVDIWIQVLVFFILSFVLLGLCKTLFKHVIKQPQAIPTNAELLIGRKCIVTEKIDNINSLGAVKIMSQIWSARSVEDAITLEIGDIAIVREIRGVKLIIEPASDDQKDTEKNTSSEDSQHIKFFRRKHYAKFY